MHISKKLEIKNFQVKTEDKQILKGVDLTINAGEIHALMGPNGSGKSTLATSLFGHPNYEITGGDVFLDGESILEMDTDERSRRGMFLAFQYPSEIPGVSVLNFLRMATKARLTFDGGKELSVREFRKTLKEKLEALEMSDSFVTRYLNDGFSGGEKKRMEILQMNMLQPNIAVLDETDSGLDVDALRAVGSGVNRLAGENFGALVITHYQRILDHIKPDFVHIMVDGRIATSGGPELVHKIEKEGYDWIAKAG